MIATFTVRTPDGYVGRLSTSEPLRGDLPAAFAYTYPLIGALTVADAWPGAVVLDGEGNEVAQ